MLIASHGAAGGEVTGSCHLIQADGKRILFDCGMVQGGHEADARNAEPFAFDPVPIDVLVISHAPIEPPYARDALYAPRPDGARGHSPPASAAPASLALAGSMICAYALRGALCWQPKA